MLLFTWLVCLMAIEKNYVKAPASRFDSEYSMGSRSRESLSSDEDDELHRRNSVDSEDDDEYDDADSGAGSDDFDLLELGETRSEFCQVGDQTCSIPFELYDLPDLHGVLSLEVWNDCLTEEERFSLTKYLPDMDEETFMCTLKELFEGSNFHFGSPITKLFQMLKGGLCEPRVSLYRQGLSFFQKHQHYHLLRKHHDSIVTSLLQMRDAWKNCKGYSIEEKLRVLNIVRSQKSLMGERNDDMGSDSSGREESGEVLWSKRNGRCIGQKTGHDLMYAGSPGLDAFSQGRLAGVDPVKYGKKNSKGLLKLAGSKTDSLNELAPGVQSRHYGYQGLKAGAHGSDLAVPRVGKASIYDAITGRQMRDQMASNDAKREMMYDMGSQREWNVAHCNTLDRGRHFKRGKKNEIFRDDVYDLDTSYSSLPLSVNGDFTGHGRNLTINQLSDIKVLTAKPSNMRAVYDLAKKAKYVDPVYEGQIRSTNGRAKQTALKGNLGDFPDADEPYWRREPMGETYLAEPPFDYEHGDVSSRKKMSRELSDSRRRPVQAPQHQMDDRIYHPKKRTKLLHENTGGNSIRNGGSSVIPLNGGKMFHGDEETESDSSDQLEQEDDSPLIMTKLALQGRLESSRSSLARSVFDRKKEKRTKKDVKESVLITDGMLPISSSGGDFGRHMQMPDIEAYSSKMRQKVKMQHPEIFQDFSAGMPDGGYGGLGSSPTKSSKSLADRLGRNGQLQAELGGRFPISVNNMTSPVDKRQKGNISHDYSLHRSKYLPDYTMEEGGGLFESDPMRDSVGSLDITLTGLMSSVKKQKGTAVPMEIDGQEAADYMQSRPQLVESVSSRKRIKKRLDADSGSPGAGIAELPVAEVGMADLELELKPPKKSFTLITPTIHTGFSFSIIHLLSAVRMALITPNPEDSLEVEKHKNVGGRSQDANAKHELNGSLEQLDVNKSAHLEQTNTPSLTVQEIVNRVKSNPGDPCILETQEPLQDLVRGVLKIFSSRTAPLGAKGWKPLVCYEKSTKSWSWTGPTPESSADLDTLEEVTSPDAWRIPHKMLVKLVDSFANWLKSGQETLQQIGSLPPPPLELTQLNYDEKERFRDLRAQKSLITIQKSSEEVKAYFRKEEHLRYAVPDRAFSYTAADGKKSIVAPLRRCGGKPTSKARDHFMLKPDRPPHVTVLCLVRDAAARLPGSIGTRADVCTLLRDSQYIVDTVSDAQVNQVVSGALDRLHYERDPCVQFDGERKLWVYLHREREEEDFEDDGTSSTKKWKRQKKDASEQDDQVTVACHGTGEATGFNLSSDLNVEPSGANNETILGAIGDDSGHRTEDDGKASHIPEESKLHCQENSADEDFDD